MKNALTKLDQHGKSEMHIEAVVKLAAKPSSTHIGPQLSVQNSLDQKHHQSVLYSLLSSICSLAHQGLHIRGHHEDINSLEGNLLRPEESGGGGSRER